MHNYCNLFVAAVSSLVKKSHGLFNMAAIGEYSVQYCSFCFVFPFCLFAFFFSLQSSTLRVKKQFVFFCVVVAFELTYISDLVFLGCAATIQSLIQLLLVQVHPSNSVYKS